MIGKKMVETPAVICAAAQWVHSSEGDRLVFTLHIRLTSDLLTRELVAGDRLFPRATARQVGTPENPPLYRQGRKFDRFPYSS